MKRYIFYDAEAVEDVNGKWVRYSDIVNDPGHIPSMQINELCRKLSGLEEAIERGHVEAGKRVWSVMSKQCWEGEHIDNGTCTHNDNITSKCTYNNCPLLKGIK